MRMMVDLVFIVVVSRIARPDSLWNEDDYYTRPSI